MSILPKPDTQLMNGDVPTVSRRPGHGEDGNILKGARVKYTNPCQAFNTLRTVARHLLGRLSTTATATSIASKSTLKPEAATPQGRPGMVGFYTMSAPSTNNFMSTILDRSCQEYIVFCVVQADVGTGLTEYVYAVGSYEDGVIAQLTQELEDISFAKGVCVEYTAGLMMGTLSVDYPINVEWWVDPPRKQGFFVKVTWLGKSISDMVVRFGVGTVISRQDNDIGYDLRLDAMGSTGNLYITGIFDGDIPNRAWGRCTHGPRFRTLWDDEPIIVVSPPTRGLERDGSQ